MATRFLYGAWDTESWTSGANQVLPGLDVFIDGSPNSPAGSGAVGGKSAGLVRVSRVPVSPSVAERWTLLGWSIRLQLVCNVLTIPIFASMGALWGGLAIGSQASNQGGFSASSQNTNTYVPVPGRAEFPPDLSTFDTIWTQDDDVALVNWLPFANGPLAQFHPAAVPAIIAKTFMFAAPPDAQAQTLLQMQLVVTPGFYGWSGNMLICPAASWSLIYDDNRNPTPALG